MAKKKQKQKQKREKRLHVCGLPLSESEEIECPNCGKLKRDYCEIAGRNVTCFECEESS